MLVYNQTWQKINLFAYFAGKTCFMKRLYMSITASCWHEKDWLFVMKLYTVFCVTNQRKPSGLQD